MRYIPKIIHLIWFGGNSYSPIVQRCIDSWRVYCPDYEIKTWNENSFDININSYVREAYDAKKWAFVSDFVRLYALYNFGGVYIDSDVEVIKSFDELLENEHVVTGYASSCWLTTGFLAAEKHNMWIKELLNYYKERHFLLSDGLYDMKVNNAIITDICKNKFGFKIGDSFIKYGKVRIYPRIYFHPYKKEVFEFNSINMKRLENFFCIDKNNTYCIHYNMGSWVTNHKTLLYKFKHIIRKIMPQIMVEWLEMKYYKLHKWTGK